MFFFDLCFQEIGGAVRRRKVQRPLVFKFSPEVRFSEICITRYEIYVHVREICQRASLKPLDRESQLFIPEGGCQSRHFADQAFDLISNFGFVCCQPSGIKSLDFRPWV